MVTGLQMSMDQLHKEGSEYAWTVSYTRKHKVVLMIQGWLQYVIKVWLAIEQSIATVTVTW